MKGLIPDDKISDIKNSADIIEIISESVLLKKGGRNFLGLCPFHSEKTPSFTVSPDKQIFKCFGCGEGGNVFTFIMKQEGISFPEAARMLANRYGIEIPTQSMTPDQKKRMTEREDLFSINSRAMNYFHYNLTKNAAGGKAKAYLAGRGLTEDMINGFKLGFALDGWDNLVNTLKHKKVSLKLAEKAGIIIEKERGYYDRFRNRIIFPIFDAGMQVTGFGGRVLDDSLPKYLNSPETPVYNKSRSLYGLHRSRQKCRDTGIVYIVEGYMDYLSLCRYGIDNTVATLGTALTPDHVRSLRGYSGETLKAVLVYDSDEAGIKAAQRSIGVFQAGHIDDFILVLPSGYDPDSYLVKFGQESFLKEAAGAKSGFRFLIESAIKKHTLSFEGKPRVIEEMLDPLSSITDSVKRAICIKELSEQTGVEERAISEKARQFSASKASGYRNQAVSHHPRTDPGRGRQAYSGRWNKMEKQIITMMLQYPDILKEIETKNVLDRFEESTMKAVGELLIRKKSNAADVSDLLSWAEDPEQRQIIAELAIGEEVWDHEGCLGLIKQFLSSRRRSETALLSAIKKAEENDDQELLIKLLNEKQTQARGLETENQDSAGGESL